MPSKRTCRLPCLHTHNPAPCMIRRWDSSCLGLAAVHDGMPALGVAASPPSKNDSTASKNPIDTRHDHDSASGQRIHARIALRHVRSACVRSFRKQSARRCRLSSTKRTCCPRIFGRVASVRQTCEPLRARMLCEASTRHNAPFCRIACCQDAVQTPPPKPHEGQTVDDHAARCPIPAPERVKITLLDKHRRWRSDVHGRYSRAGLVE